MKFLKALIVFIVLFSLVSCGSDEENNNGDGPNKFTGFKSDANSIGKSTEVLFLEDKTKTPEEKIDFIKEKLEKETKVFKEKKTLNKSLDIALDYLEEKKKEEKKELTKGNSSSEKVEELKTEQEEIKELVEELIDEQEEGSVEEALYEGELELVEENFEEAIENFEEAFEAAETDEERAEALVGEADVHQEMGNDEEAEETYEEALEYDEDNVDANIGDALYDIDDDLLEDAEETLENIDEENLEDDQAITVEVLKSLILTLQGEYRESNEGLLAAETEFGGRIDIYSLMLENYYFLSMLLVVNSYSLPIEQTGPIFDGYKTKALNSYNSALALDPTRVYVYYYYGLAQYLLESKAAGIQTVRTGLTGIDGDATLNTQEKKDNFAKYVEVVEKINTFNTTFDYTPAEFDVIIEEDKGVFEKFYRLIDRTRLEQLTVVFEN